MSDTTKRWLNTKEAAEYLGVSTDKLWHWRQANEGPRYSQPSERIIRYDIEDLQTFMEAHSGGTEDACA